jgi:hypothetical protein
MTSATQNLKTIHELRKYEGPLYIQNNTPTRVHCHEKLGEGQVDFELDPAGGPDSVMMVPKLALEVRGIQKMWLRGDLTVSTDESMEDQIALLLNRDVKAPQDRLDAILSTGGDQAKLSVEAPSNTKALVERPCLECGQRDRISGVITNGRVVQNLHDVKEGLAPLCEVHLGLAPQFVARPVQDDQGNTTWDFDKVSLTAPVIGEPK